MVGAQQRNKRLLSTFSRYVGPSVLNEMVPWPEDSLTPTQREVTVLIADMGRLYPHHGGAAADRRRPADP